MSAGRTRKSEETTSLPRHIRNVLLNRGIGNHTSLLVACSGGRDSVVLLEAVVDAGFEDVALIHVDHGIRTLPERSADRELVNSLARRRGVPVSFCEIPAGEIAATAVARAESVEAVARQRRYREFCRTVQNAGNPSNTVLLTAHHDDDVAETVVMRIFSGRSPCEPLGIDAETTIHGIRVLRPLIGVSRAVISHYATDRGLSWNEDRTNTDERYLRNVVRHTVIPEIARHFPSVVAHLARFHREHRDMQCALAELIPGDAWGEVGSDGEWSVSLTALSRLPSAARELVLRRAHKAVVPDVRAPFRPVFQSVEGVLSRKTPGAGTYPVTVSGTEILIDGDILTLRGRIVRPAESGYLLEVSGDGCIRFQPDAVPTEVRGDAGLSQTARLFLGPLTPPVVVRALRPGDRLVNGGAERSWKELFQRSGLHVAAENAHVIEDVRGTVAMVRSSGEYVIRDGVSDRSSDVPGTRSVCVQFND